ncbi:LamG-like jellyroll fold domain-containing protein [Actinoplanes sp. CA-142083]|uniref:LamG-like jellyroll fold domain-containing protein n=1 Tax=Actinoplanes sp. CA-142083 TaxID=3239903 RepID=UPI003D937627
MKIAITFAAMAGLLVPASTARAASATPSDTPPAAATVTAGAPAAGTPAAPLLVARWDFDAGPVAGRVSDTSGRGVALTIRGADQGVIQFEGGATGGKYVAFPVACATAATVCPRGLLEAANNVNLNPGTRLFRWSARVHLTKAQVVGSANIMQKGVAGTGSQWKMQVGATNGRAQCVASGSGSPTVYIARSTATVADGLWHKILCQRAGTSLAVYVDGIRGGQATIPSTLAIANTLPLRIGGPNFNTRSDMYHGLLDDVYAELG